MLINKAKKAILWSSIESIIRQAIGFVISVILARLLLPEDFGTVALLALFLGLAGLFVHAGLGNALVQRQDITHTDESTVFWFNLLVALAMMLLLFGIAPWIAEFFGIAALAPLTMLMAVNIPIGALGIVHGALMAKRLDFKTPMKVGVASSLVSGLVAVAMAFAAWARGSACKRRELK
jgi:O-antigen/teichoic acid export membrane protein